MTMAGWCFPSRLRDLRKKNQNVLEAEAWTFGPSRLRPYKILPISKACPSKKRDTTMLLFSVGVVGRIFVHGFAFGAARFVDDAREEAANRGVGKRAGIFALRVPNDFALAIGLIERKISLLLDFSDLERAMRTLV